MLYLRHRNTLKQVSDLLEKEFYKMISRDSIDSFTLLTNELDAVAKKMRAEKRYGMGRRLANEQIRDMIKEEVPGAVAEAMEDGFREQVRTAIDAVSAATHKMVVEEEETVPVISYAGVSKGSKAMSHSVEKNHVLLVYPKKNSDGEPILSSEETSKTQGHSPRDEAIKVQGFRRIKNGGVAIIAANEARLQKIRETPKLKGAEN